MITCTKWAPAIWYSSTLDISLNVMFFAFTFPCFCLRAGWRGWWWVHSEAETAQGGGRLSTGKPHINTTVSFKIQAGWIVYCHCLEFLEHDLHWWDCVQGGCKRQCGPAGAAGKSSGAFALPYGRLWCSHKPRLDLLGKDHFPYLDINIRSTCEVAAEWWRFPTSTPAVFLLRPHQARKKSTYFLLLV